MNKKEQSKVDRHLDTPSEANTEKHINFPEVEEESSKNFAIDKTPSNRQKQWQKEIKEGDEEKERSNPNNTAARPMDNDDTLGVP